MIDKNGTILRNLEDQVQYLTDINQLASLGFRVRGKVDSPSSLVVDDRCVNGDVMLVGTDKPYHLWVFVTSEWVDLGEFPRRGLPGCKGEKGDSIVGPRGEKGDPSQIPGPAGKNGNGLGVDYITKLDLSSGNPSVSYDNASGATLAKSGVITAAGQEYNINVTDKLPIVAGDNIDIFTNGTNSALKIGAKVPVTSVNGQKGDVRLSIPTDTSDLTNNAHFVTEDYHDNTKQDTLVSGQNIKTINNQSILGSGNITISGGGGGGGTDTGFGNVKEIQAADDHTTYNPDTGEYVITSGYADIFYKDNTKERIPYVQGIGLMAGDNITFTEELINNTNWRLKINATGGGSSSVQQTNGIYPYNEPITGSPTLGSTYSYSDSKITYPSGCSYFYGQMIIDTNGAIYRTMGTTMCKCVSIPQGGGSGGSTTLYQHTITYASDHFTSMEDFTGTDVSGNFSASFYSTHGHFNDASEFWTWLIGRGSIDVFNGHLWGSMGGDDPLDRIEVAGNTDADKYIRFVAFGGYGDWTASWFMKNTAATGLTDTITDGCRDM